MRIIKLKPNGVGRYDNVSPFIVTDNRLELQVELPNFNGEFFLVYENNGKTEKRLLPRSGQLVLENLTAGELNAKVVHTLKGEDIKTWAVEPLLLKEVDSTLSALPELEELHRYIYAVERDFAAYKQTATENEKQHAEREKQLISRLEVLEKNFNAFVQFAYKDYRDNVYLSGGTVQDFIKEFGFELTIEQINSLTGGKESDED